MPIEPLAFVNTVQALLLDHSALELRLGRRFLSYLSFEDDKVEAYVSFTSQPLGARHRRSGIALLAIETLQPRLRSQTQFDAAALGDTGFCFTFPCPWVSALGHASAYILCMLYARGLHCQRHVLRGPQ